MTVSGSKLMESTFPRMKFRCLK